MNLRRQEEIVVCNIAHYGLCTDRECHHSRPHSSKVHANWTICEWNYKVGYVFIVDKNGLKLTSDEWRTMPVKGTTKEIRKQCEPQKAGRHTHM
jgi:hypothetical protein